MKEVLYSFADLAVGTFEVFDSNKIYKKSIQEYKSWRKKHKLDNQKIYRLKKQGILKNNSNGEFILTDKAVKILQKTNLETIKIKHPEKWDEIWRVVVFDIPEKKKPTRETFRKTLKKLGFIPVQKSIFCYPYDCLKEISYIIDVYEIKPFVTYLEVSNIVTDINLIEKFENNGTFGK